MTLEEAKDRIGQYQLRWLRDIPELAGKSILSDDKGIAGKVLEELLGLNYAMPGNDFIDGELKTTNASRDGIPKENVYVLQLRPNIDTLLKPHTFQSSKVYRKIRNTLIVPVFRATPSPANWMFFHPWHLNLDSPSQMDILESMTHSYEALRAWLSQYLDDGGELSTSREHGYLQIRNKDSQPYKPIYSQHHRRFISKRDFAFWLRKQLMTELKSRQQWGVKWT